MVLAVITIIVMPQLTYSYQMKSLSILGLEKSDVTLQRAHVVLTYILHFYIHTLPVSDPVSIPRTISIPLLYASQRLDISPVITYVDSVFNNWDYITRPEQPNGPPATDNI